MNISVTITTRKLANVNEVVAGCIIVEESSLNGCLESKAVKVMKFLSCYQYLRALLPG